MSGNPLSPIQQSLGAFLVRRAGISVPDYFDDPVAEHVATRRSVGLFDLTSAGKLRVEGSDRVRFLQALVSSDVSRLSPGQGCQTLLLTPAGKVASLLRLVVFEDHVLVLAPSITRAKVLRTLRDLVAASDVSLTDVTATHVLLSLQGSASDHVARRALGVEPSAELRAFGGETVSTPNHGRVTCVRSPRSGELGLDLLLHVDRAASVYRELLAAVHDADGAPAGLRALDSLRIETGLPAYGADVDESSTPHEADLFEQLVSLEKGCFLGRDAVQAMEFHGRPERKLRGIAFHSGVSPVPGDRVLCGDVEVGRISSACYAPTLGYAVALAMLASPQVRRGSAVRVVDGELGVVTRLPFPRDAH